MRYFDGMELVRWLMYVCAKYDENWISNSNCCYHILWYSVSMLNGWKIIPSNWLIRFDENRASVNYGWEKRGSKPDFEMNEKKNESEENLIIRIQWSAIRNTVCWVIIKGKKKLSHTFGVWCLAWHIEVLIHFQWIHSFFELCTINKQQNQSIDENSQCIIIIIYIIRVFCVQCLLWKLQLINSFLFDM